MDHVKEILLRKLIATDDFMFIYNEKDVHHGDVEKISSFLKQVRTEVKDKLNFNMSGTYIYILFYCFYSFLVYNKIIIILYFFECLENELKNVWYKMRGKFVRINLKKSRVQPVSVTEEVFYNNLIFIEDFISHKNADVFKTINKKEIINDTYDRIMGNTYNELDENMGEELNLDNERNNDFEDTSDTEELIILEGHEDVVYQFLNSKKNSNEKTTNSP